MQQSIARNKNTTLMNNAVEVSASGNDCKVQVDCIIK